jgi:hypothetical protein
MTRFVKIGLRDEWVSETEIIRMFRSRKGDVYVELRDGRAPVTVGFNFDPDRFGRRIVAAAAGAFVWHFYADGESDEICYEKKPVVGWVVHEDSNDVFAEPVLVDPCHADSLVIEQPDGKFNIPHVQTFDRFEQVVEYFREEAKREREMRKPRLVE